MRKVEPENEIPIAFLEPEAARDRIIKFNSQKLSRKALKDLTRLSNYMTGLNGMTVDSVKVLDRIYKSADFYMKDAVYSKAVCAKGCAHCCNKIPVEVTVVEVDYIMKKSGLTLTVDYDAPLSKGGQRPSPESEPCPLLDLKTATCRAYEHRPLQCRLFASMDHYELCEDPTTSHYTHRASSNPFWNIILGNVALMATQAAEQMNMTPVADIRDFIKTRFEQ